MTKNSIQFLRHGDNRKSLSVTVVMVLYKSFLWKNFFLSRESYEKSITGVTHEQEVMNHW